MLVAALAVLAYPALSAEANRALAGGSWEAGAFLERPAVLRLFRYD